MCKECVDEQRYTLNNEQWTKKKRLLTLLIGERCKELTTSRNCNESMTSSWEELHRAYRDVHDNTSIGATKTRMKHLFRYVDNRINSKITFHNLTPGMIYRHQLYKKIYKLEFQCHGGNEIETLKCLNRNKGGQILDLKESPTKLQKVRFGLYTVGDI